MVYKGRFWLDIATERVGGLQSSFSTVSVESGRPAVHNSCIMTHGGGLRAGVGMSGAGSILPASGDNAISVAQASQRPDPAPRKRQDSRGRYDAA
jgi:hypothetical protein